MAPNKSQQINSQTNDAKAIGSFGRPAASDEASTVAGEHHGVFQRACCQGQDGHRDRQGEKKKGWFQGETGGVFGMFFICWKDVNM